MAPLPLCAACAAEYEDPGSRRFHAQTIACRQCGPTLQLHLPGTRTVVGDEALAEARDLIGAGAIVAIKGLGGYHLACDATNEDAVAVLRKRKDRGDKPFAVMVGDLAQAERIAHVSAHERDLLTSPRRPVVLLARRPQDDLAPARSVAPDAADIGVLLPYTPVHRLLFGLPGDPPGPALLVMTSGNVSGEPLAIDDDDARTRLGGLADAWLRHDRSIRLPCDDSVVRVAAGAQLPVRRSRGYAPLPVTLPLPATAALAVGGDLKTTFCVAEGSAAWLSAHVGDMDDLATLRAFDRATRQLGELTGVRPDVLVCDKHPGYRSSAWARRNAGGRPVVAVQHHHAHVAAAMAENGWPVHRPVLGFAFDGTGFGEDAAVWGGELLHADYAGYQRIAHLRYVPLPGGNAGVRNPCRMALSHLRAAGVGWDARLPAVAACTPSERSVVARQIDTGLGCTPTSSMGRLFDAVSSLAGVCHRAAYEAEAAMRFEALARNVEEPDGYRFDLCEDEIDAAPVVRAVVEDVQAGAAAATVSARFHAAVADLVLDLARRQRRVQGVDAVALSGGVFLNTVLTEACVRRLDAAGFTVLRHRLVPPSDAGLALGQIAVGATAPPSVQ
jgi:hydrogenase maturation protein HypF